MKPICALCLMLAPASLLAGCTQGPSASEAAMQERIAEADARVKAAEQRAKNAEAMAELHRQEPKPPVPITAPAEVAQGDTEFGQPVNDTAPIEPAPAMPENSQP